MEYWRSLPVDVAEEILARFPAKTVARLRSTSKQWNALLKYWSFAKIHSAKAPKEESLVISLIHSRVCLVRIDLRGDHDNKFSPSAKVASQLYLKVPFSNSSQVNIREVFHCDGLLLCTTKDSRLAVWNPCSGETKWAKPRVSYKESDYYALGYEQNSLCKQYKILRVDRQDIQIKNEYEIYDFTSNSWRVVGVATDWFLGEYRRGISVKGITYWGSTQVETPHVEFLLSFDFSTERFQSLSLPLSHPFPYSIAALSVVGEKHLFLLCTACKFWITGTLEVNDFQVWVANNTGSVGSWRKSLGVGFYRGKKYPNGMSFLVDEQNEVVMYLGDNNILHIVCKDKYTYTQIEGDTLGGDSTCTSSSCSVLLNYVPSLAQIQQGGGRKRKTPSTCDL
ncbi:hypothetical protein EUTSA_v10022074mg [Eutrema salsugineum]|uniref:F-box domain-containing protein n=1 Tax=Eutrema salsugineum TaxID=72664 RepID=V4LUP7_EUTSA|nr:putative F-box protein At3g23260 [Eutrema salsugineum]ESQ47529.1 hypothetical protein EUTSA_v10022074mg [Eutrema salsugineum]